jgi:hypothetical protein
VERFLIQIKMKDIWVTYPERCNLTECQSIAAFKVLTEQLDLFSFRIINETTLEVVQESEELEVV